MQLLSGQLHRVIPHDMHAERGTGRGGTHQVRVRACGVCAYHTSGVVMLFHVLFVHALMRRLQCHSSAGMRASACMHAWWKTHCMQRHMQRLQYSFHPVCAQHADDRGGRRSNCSRAPRSTALRTNAPPMKAAAAKRPRTTFTKEIDVSRVVGTCCVVNVSSMCHRCVVSWYHVHIIA